MKIVKYCWQKKYYLLFFILFGILVNQRFLNTKTSGLAGSVSIDGNGYYYYLPATLIYHDFSYSFYDNEKNKIKPIYKPYLTPYINNQLVNKYYCGTALCLSPFFICGMAVSAIAGTPINGYTDTFLMLVSIAGIIYFLLAVFLLIEIGKFFSVPEKISFWTALLFFFGTNLYHFTIQEPSMSHLYSFFAVALFFYLLTKVIPSPSKQKLFFLGLSLGLVALIRPPNLIIILFVPFFFHSLKEFVDFVKALITKQFWGLLLMLLAFFLMLSIQSFFYYIQTGDFFIMAYPGETFDFEDPEIMNILFSYRKGLFLYTPLIFVALLFIVFAGKDGYKKAITFITLGVFLYITASWWCWTYGGGLGNRPFIDIYPIIIITVLYLFNKVKRPTKFIVITLCVPFVFINQLMAYQYANRMMNTIGNITKEDYWDLFLATDMQTINSKKIKRLYNPKLIVDSKIDGFEFTLPNSWIVQEGYKSKHACKIGAKNNYSNTFVIPMSMLETQNSYDIIAECMAKPDKRGEMMSLVIGTFDIDKITSWEATFVKQFDSLQNGWVYMNTVYHLDKYQVNPQKEIRVLACSFNGKCLVDNLRYRIIKVKASN